MAWRMTGKGLFTLIVAALCAGGCGDDSPGPPGGNGDVGDALIADHEAVAFFAAVQAATRDHLQQQCSIFYGHTSHGSQILTGLGMVEDQDASWSPPAFHELSDDLGTLGDVTWVAPTRAYLDAHPGDVDLVMWSWCGGVSTNTAGGIQAYLDAMGALEADYPGVVFIYMTGHLDGTGEAGNLFVRNEQIRAWCRDHGKVLFDFADIETWDPDGVYHPDDTDACNWCAQWCTTHDCPDCAATCAHSRCFNCYRKGQAFWVLLARLVGEGRL